MRYAGQTLDFSLEEQNLSDVEVELVTLGIRYKTLGPHLLRKLLSVHRQFMSLQDAWSCQVMESRPLSTHPPAAAAWRHVLPNVSGVSISKPADSTCSSLIKDTMLYFCPSQTTGDIAETEKSVSRKARTQATGVRRRSARKLMATAQHSNFIWNTVKSRQIYFCLHPWVCHSPSFNPRARNLWNQFERSRAADRQTEHARNMDSWRAILTGRDRRVLKSVPSFPWVSDVGDMLSCRDFMFLSLQSWKQNPP